ncbi:hypothetical protein ABGI61_13935 [Rheinheimera sp. FR7-31]|uniref:hypothetical protein n=1 Tax=Rheinheimera fenheensis TaxID=3152295 RepID=UPI00325D17B5
MRKIILFVSILFLSLSSYAEDGSGGKRESKEAAELMVQLDENSQHNVSENVGIVKDIFHIAFFITVAVLALLSYLQAKKTVFSPIKTEIFKYQLKAFEEVIGPFQNKGEIELKNDMDMDSIIDINTFDLFNSYVSTFMKDEVSIDEKFAKEKMNMACGAIVSKEFAEEYFQPVGSEAPVFPNNESPNEPALKLAKWNNRKYGLVHFTKEYSIATAEMKRFQNSPLLPSGLKELLNEYSALMEETLSAVGEALEEAGKNMPTNFPTAKKLKNFNPSWVSNIHNDKAPRLEPKAMEILNFINEYLGVDDLAKKSV